MTAGAARRLGEARRATFAGLADILIPEAEGMPSASQADVHGKWLDKVVAARPDLLAGLVAVLDGAAGKEPAEAVRQLHVSGDDGFAALALAATGGYYMNPKIRKLIGYPGQKSSPPYPDEAAYYLRDGILDPVRERGSIFRPTAGP